MEVTSKIGVKHYELREEIDRCRKKVKEILNKWKISKIYDIPFEDDCDLASLLDNKEGCLRELSDLIEHLDDVESDIRKYKKEFR